MPACQCGTDTPRPAGKGKELSESVDFECETAVLARLQLQVGERGGPRKLIQLPCRLLVKSGAAALNLEEERGAKKQHIT